MASLALAPDDRGAPKVTIEEHQATSLIRDERVQRALRPVRVKDIAAKLAPDSIGVITVSKRDDGLVILDGQHRVQALIDCGIGDTTVTCRVFHGLTLAEEAGLFRRLNNTSKTTAIEDLMKGIVEGDPECVAISKIAERQGLRIALQTGDGFISCAGAMRKTFRSGGEAGPAALGFALHVATAAWGTASDSVDGHLVTGLGMLYLRYGEELDRSALIRKLSKHKGGGPGLLGQAKALRSMRPATVGRCVATIALDVYNRGRNNRLPPL